LIYLQLSGKIYFSRCNFVHLSPAQLKILCALATIRTLAEIEIDLSQHGRHEKMCVPPLGDSLVHQVGQSMWHRRHMVNVEKGRGRSRKAAVRGNPINVKFIATIHHLKSEIGERGGRCVCAVDGWQQHFAVGGFIIMGNIVQAATFH